MRVNEVLSRINDSTPIMLIIGDFILHTGTKRGIYSNIIYQRNRQKYGGALVTEILLDDKFPSLITIKGELV